MTTPHHDPFADAARSVLADHCTPDVVRRIERAHCTASAQSLWAALQDAGFADALLPEAAGGAGLNLNDVCGVLAQCGAHAMPLPLGETMVARALLAQAGTAHPAGSIALATGQQHPDGSVRCSLLRMGAVADHALVQVGARWYVLALADAERTPHAQALDVAAHWRAAHVQAAVQCAAPDSDGQRLHTLHAVVSAAYMAGALEQVFARTLQYANERQQFGRPIGKFQAIQHQLAVMSEHVAAARMAAQLGCSGAALQVDRLRAATAKARCSEAALAVAELAHSIHGAIGFTEEYDLQLFTRRLHAWRHTAGAESHWHTVAGQALLAHCGLTLDVVRRITDLDVASSAA